jgi:transcriptional regulator with XRE-family HTH domain
MPFSRMDIREILAINLRKLRQARGLSQEELAHRAEIDRTYISALGSEAFMRRVSTLSIGSLAAWVSSRRPAHSPAHKHQEKDSGQAE